MAEGGYQSTVTNEIHLSSTGSGTQRTQNANNITRNQPMETLSCCFRQDLNAATVDLTKRLKELYSQVTLPPIPWMQKENHCLMDYYAELKLDSSREPIELKNIFSPLKTEELKESQHEVPFLMKRIFQKLAKSKLPRRIFIEAKAGYGKTTLMTKLAYDWAVGKKYMQNFKLLFVVKLRKIEDVKSALNRIAKDCGFQKFEMLEEMIDKTGKKVLILLDGYDEVPPGSLRDSIHRILYKTDYGKATVAMTCKNEMFDPRDKQMLPFFSNSMIHRKIEFWDRKVIVGGVSEKGQQKILETEKSKELFEKLKDPTVAKSDILNSPLILMLLSFLYANGKKVDVDVRSTNLFKNITNGLLSYNVEKQHESSNGNNNFFESQKIVLKSLKKDFVEFGRICIPYLEKSNFEFEYSDLMERVYSTGFLVKIKSTSNNESKTWYEPIHQSFVEFFVALSIYYEFNKSDGNALRESTIISLNKIFFETRGTSLVLPFLVGMLNSKAHNFFNQLGPNAQLYANLQNGLWKILEECKETEPLIESLLPFIPLRMTLSGETFADTNLFSSLIVNANQHSSLHTLNMNIEVEEDYAFPQKTHFKQIRLFIGNNTLTEERYEKCTSILQNVSCSEITFVFMGQFESSEAKRDMLIKFMKICEKPELKRRSLYIEDDSTCNLLTSCFKSQALKAKKIHHLHCYETGDGNWEEFLKLLFAGNQLKTLRLRVNNQNNWRKVEDILKSTPTSALLGLSIDNDFDLLIDNYRVNMKCLAGGLKKWEYLKFSPGIKLACDVMEKFQTKELVLMTDDVNVETLSNSEISVLDCPSKVLARLLETNESRSLFSSLIELKLSIGGICLQQKFWKDLKRFQQIEKLSLEFSEKSFTSYENILAYLQSTNIILLEILVDNSTLDTTAKFVKCLKESLPWNERRLTTFHVCVWEKLTNLSEMSTHLLKCVEEQNLEEICISWRYNYFWKWESMDWVDTKKFRMDRSFLGMKKTDMKHWRREYKNGVLYDSIRISLK